MPRRRGSKREPSYYLGFDHGMKVAHEDIDNHGLVFADVHGLRSLEANARKRGTDAWSKGYTAGYRVAYHARGGR